MASGVKTQARAVAQGAADLVPYFGGALASLPGVAARYTSEVRSGEYPDTEFAFLNTRIRRSITATHAKPSTTQPTAPGSPT